jgi:hypothetical protein
MRVENSDQNFAVWPAEELDRRHASGHVEAESRTIDRWSGRIAPCSCVGNANACKLAKLKKQSPSRIEWPIFGRNRRLNARTSLPASVALWPNLCEKDRGNHDQRHRSTDPNRTMTARSRTAVLIVIPARERLRHFTRVAIEDSAILAETTQQRPLRHAPPDVVLPPMIQAG